MPDRSLGQGPAQSVVDSSPRLFDGTQAAGATAAPLNGGTSQHTSEVLVQNDPGSPAAIKVGNATSQSLTLPIGASVIIPVDDLTKIYVKRVGGVDCTVNFWGRD